MRLTSAERRDFAETMAGVAEGLDRDGPFADAWEVEQVALSSLPVLVQDDAPAELVDLFVAAIETRQDATAASVLIAMARLAHPPLRDLAGEAAGRLAASGIVSPLEAEIGSLRVQDAAILSVDGDVAALVCLLQRPSTPDLAQGVLAFIEPDGGALVQIQTSDPEPLSEARRRFEITAPEGKRRAATADEVLEVLERAVGAGAPLLDEMLLDLAILERGLTGEDMRLPRPPVYPIEMEDDIEEQDESFAGRLVDQMVAEGVDPRDPEALAAWMEDYNARPYAERRAITGELPPAGPRAGAPKRKKQQRRQAKAARKRNRRR